jgi:hypothetical protein
MTPVRERGDREVGLSLIELIIYVVIASVLLSAMAMILVNSWRTQENVLSETEATNRGQLVSSIIERAVRNGLAVQVSGGDTLKVRTSLGGGRQCQGFRLGGGVATMTMNSGPLGSTWPEWQDDIAVIPGEPLIKSVGSTVTYAFQITTTSAPVRFVGTVSARNPTGVTSPCW